MCLFGANFKMSSADLKSLPLLGMKLIATFFFPINHTVWNIGRYEPHRDKTYLLICAPKDDSNQPAHQCSLISLRCPNEETLHSLYEITPIQIY